VGLKIEGRKNADRMRARLCKEKWGTEFSIPSPLDKDRPSLCCHALTLPPSPAGVVLRGERGGGEREREEERLYYNNSVYNVPTDGKK